MKHQIDDNQMLSIVMLSDFQGGLVSFDVIVKDEFGAWGNVFFRAETIAKVNQALYRFHLNSSLPAIPGIIVETPLQNLDEFEKISELVENGPDISASMQFNDDGMYKMRYRDYKKAIEDITKAITIYPNNELSHFMLGNIYMEIGPIEKAITEYEATLNIKPLFKRAMLNLSIALLVARRLEDGVYMLHRIMKTDVENSDLCLILRDFFPDTKIMGDRQLSYIDMRKRCTINDNSQEDYAIRGLEDSAARYCEILATNPNDIISHFCLGLIFSRISRDQISIEEKASYLEEAIEVWQKLLRIEPNDIDARFNLGLAFYENGNIEKASDTMRELLREDFPEGYYLQIIQAHRILTDCADSLSNQ